MSEKDAADFYLEDFFAPWTSEIVKKTRKPWIAAVTGFALGLADLPWGGAALAAYLALTLAAAWPTCWRVIF